MKGRITKRSVDALKPTDRKATLWDTELVGFGVSAYPSGAKVYALRYFHRGRDKRMTLGRHGELTADQARRLAAKRLGEVRNDRDPLAERKAARAAARDPQTVEWLFREFLAAKTGPDAKRPWKPSTEAEVRRIYAAEIEGSKLGKRPLRDVTTQDVEAFHRAFMRRERPAPYAANRALAWVRAAFTHAVYRGLRLDNPCKAVQRYAEEARNRALSLSELARFGEALDALVTERPHEADARDALRLLALTGLRRDSVLNLRWREVVFEERLLALEDTKSGKKVKGLGEAALGILERRRKAASKGAEWVFPARRGDGPLRDTRTLALDAFAKAEIRGAVPHHTLRHSYASQAAELCYSELAIGGLLGHAKSSVTSKYVKLDKLLREAEEAVQARIGAALDRREPAKVVALPAADSA